MGYPHAEVSERDGIAPSYMPRVIRLTLLAPDIVKAALDGKKTKDIALPRLLSPLPVEWNKQ